MSKARPRRRSGTAAGSPNKRRQARPLPFGAVDRAAAGPVRVLVHLPHSRIRCIKRGAARAAAKTSLCGTAAGPHFTTPRTTCTHGRPARPVRPECAPVVVRATHMPQRERGGRLSPTMTRGSPSSKRGKRPGRGAVPHVCVAQAFFFAEQRRATTASRIPRKDATAAPVRVQSGRCHGPSRTK